MALRLSSALAFALATAAGSAQASSIADLGLSLEQIRALNAQLTAPIAAPGIAFGAPTGFGAAWGQAFGGIGGRTLAEGDQDLDGSALIGFGMGDARVLGLETAMNIVSLSEGFAKDGSWGFKVHHSFPWRAALAVGVDDAAGWGDAAGTDSSSYVAYSQVVDLAGDAPKRPLGLAITVGAGKGRFSEPESDPAEEGDSFAPFGSLALNWHRQSSVIADWHSGDLNLAVSVVPLYRLPLVATIGFINVTERFEPSDFAAGVGYLYQF